MIIVGCVSDHCWVCQLSLLGVSVIIVGCVGDHCWVCW